MSDLIDREAVRLAKVPYDEMLSEYERGWNDACEAIADNVPASPWHRVEEPPKEEGKYFVAYRSRVVDGWGYDTAYYTKHLEDKMLMIPVPENSEGWFKWSDYNDCDVLVHPDYWMPIEPPKEDA